MSKVIDVKRFLEYAEEQENIFPFLYVEICRTRTTDFMAWLREKPNGKLIVCGQGATANDACKDAMEQVNKKDSK